MSDKISGLINVQRTGDQNLQSIKALVCGSPGTGKGLPLDAPVLAPGGWRPIGELQEGDEITSASGRSTIVTHIFDRGKQPMFRVTFSDGAVVDCDADHLWSVQTQRMRSNQSSNWQTWSTQELHAHGVRQPQDGRRDAYRFYVPIVGVVQHDKQDLPVDPYLLGVLLANGSLKDDSIIFSTNEQQIVDLVRDRNPHLDIVEATSPVGTVRRFRIRGFNQVIRDLNLKGLGSAEKFVPESYLVADEDSRRLLLAGLMDCDGSAPVGNRRSRYFTTSPRLRDGVVDLVRSLGGMCPSIGVDERAENACFGLSIELEANPFLLKRKAESFASKRPWRAIESIESIESTATRCIKVDAHDELFVTSGHVVTHNTLFASTAPDPFIINTDHGLASLRERDVPFATVPDTKADIEAQNVSKFIGQMLAILQGGEDSMKKHLGYVPKTIVIDTFDMIVGLLIKEYLKKNGQSALKIQDYSWLKERLKALTGGFRNLDMHVIFTCHLKDKSDDDAANLRTVPAIDGSFAEDIAGWFDLAVILKNEVVSEVVDNKMTRNVRKYMQTFPEPPRVDWVKDRFGALPHEFDLNLEDDFSRIQKLVFGNDTDNKAA